MQIRGKRFGCKAVRRRAKVLATVVTILVVGNWPNWTKHRYFSCSIARFYAFVEADKELYYYATNYKFAVRVN